MKQLPTHLFVRCHEMKYPAFLLMASLRDVIDVNDDKEDTLEVAKYIFNIKILYFSMQTVKSTFKLKS